MKNKIFSAILCFSIMGLMVSCSKGDSGDTTTASASSATTVTEQSEEVSEITETTTETEAINTSDTSIYGFTFKGVTLHLGDDFSQYLEVFGEPDSFFESESCAAQGMDRTYTYGGIDFFCFDDGKTVELNAICFYDDLSKTDEGISVGSSYDDVIEVYGDSDPSESETIVQFTDGNTTLTFLIIDNKVECIQYILAE